MEIQTAAGWDTNPSVEVQPIIILMKSTAFWILWHFHKHTEYIMIILLIYSVYTVTFQVFHELYLLNFFALVNCGKPDVDFNGMVYGSDWWVGSVVRYDCRPGFVLVGDPARACQSSGKWTPKPSCLSKSLSG